MTTILPRPLHWLLVILHLLLIACGLISLWQETSFQGDESPFVRWLPYLIMATVLYAPLVLMLPAVISANSRLLIWLCIVLLLYFTGYLLQLMDSASSFWSIAKFTTTLALFVVVCWAVRIQTRKTTPAGDTATDEPATEQHPE